MSTKTVKQQTKVAMPNPNLPKYNGHKHLSTPAGKAHLKQHQAGQVSPSMMY